MDGAIITALHSHLPWFLLGYDHRLRPRQSQSDGPRPHKAYLHILRIFFVKLAGNSPDLSLPKYRISRPCPPFQKFAFFFPWSIFWIFFKTVVFFSGFPSSPHWHCEGARYGLLFIDDFLGSGRNFQVIPMIRFTSPRKTELGHSLYADGLQ